MQDADAALTGHGDGRPGLRDGVHRSRQQRNAEREVTGQPRRGVDLAGNDVRLARQEQDVVVRQAERSELVRNALFHEPMLLRRPQCWWPWPAWASSSSAGFSTTSVSVVSSSEAIEAALASAERVTLTGSMTPAASRSPYSPVAALKPWPARARPPWRPRRSPGRRRSRRSSAAARRRRRRTMRDAGRLVAGRGRGRRRAPPRRG